MSDSGRLTELLARWCGIASDRGAPAGQAAMADELVAALTPIAATVRSDAAGPEQVPLVRARSADRDGARVLLVGHLDTVPHDDGGAGPVTRIADGRLYGRGSADMKGGLVVMLEALARAEAGGRAPAWEALIVSDEEIGTPWCRDALMEAATTAAVAIVLEPAMPDGGIVRSRKGVGTVELRIAGRAAHAGRNPTDGRSAIRALADLVGAIEDLADDAAGTSVNVTMAAGGNAPNVVAAHASLTVDFRVRSLAESDRVMASIATAAEMAGTTRGVAVTVVGGLNRPPMAAHPESEVLFATYRAIVRRHGGDVSWNDVGGGSDANFVAQAGIPVLDGLGVRGGNLHGPAEFAEIASIEERADALAELLIALGAGA